MNHLKRSGIFICLLILLLWIPFVSGADIDNSTDINADLTEYDMSDTSVDEISINNDSVDLDVNDYSIVLKSGNDLVRGSTVNVSGHLFDSDERPVKDYLLVVESDDWMNEVYTDGDGFFTTECFINQDLTFVDITDFNGIFVNLNILDNLTEKPIDITDDEIIDENVSDDDIGSYYVELVGGNDLVRGSTVNVSGHVFDSNKKPVSGLFLVVESDDWMNEVYTDGDGFFTTECFIDQDLTCINIAQYNGDILFELNLTDESEIEPVVDDVTIIEPSQNYVYVNSSNDYNETINEIITTEPTVKYDSDKMYSGESSEISEEVTSNAPYVIVKDVDDSNTKTKTTISSNIKNTVSGFLTKNIKESGNFIHVTKDIYPDISMETVGSDIGSDYNESLDESILVSEQSTDNQSESIIEYILSLLSEIYRWFSSLF